MRDLSAYTRRSRMAAVSVVPRGFRIPAVARDRRWPSDATEPLSAFVRPETRLGEPAKHGSPISTLSSLR